MFRPAEEMHMVRHDDVTTNRPMMTFARVFPFVNQHTGGGFICKNSTPIFCANCDEIDWGLNPNTIETTQMLVHEQELRRVCSARAKKPQPTAAATGKADEELRLNQETHYSVP